MEYADIPQSFESAESVGFLKVPLPVPPMIEAAFRYRGHERYVSLGFGIHGGVMSDFVGESVRPRSRYLYRSFLSHPAIKPYTDAFQIETDPPTWLEGMSIDECDRRQEEFETWSEARRCLLLDRECRQFFVGTIAEIRQWLILRPAFCITGEKRIPGDIPQSICFKAPEQALSDWLAVQSTPSLAEDFVAEWERIFHTRQSIAGCTAAAFRLGFGHHDVRRMMAEAFTPPDSEA
jgi:hypothetical protein